LLYAPPLGVRVGPLDVRLQVIPADAVIATSADLGRTQLSTTDQGVALGQAGIELLGNLRAGEEAGSHDSKVGP
jgi:hypothetical protein